MFHLCLLFDFWECLDLCLFVPLLGVSSDAVFWASFRPVGVFALRDSLRVRRVDAGRKVLLLDNCAASAKNTHEESTFVLGNWASFASAKRGTARAMPVCMAWCMCAILSKTLECQNFGLPREILCQTNKGFPYWAKNSLDLSSKWMPPRKGGRLWTWIALAKSCLFLLGSNASLLLEGKQSRRHNGIYAVLAQKSTLKHVHM